MLVSCKISNSILSFLDRRGEDLENIYEQSDLPAEFLKDTSYWLEAGKMEGLLFLLNKELGHIARDGNLIQEVGHQCKDLRTWGVLDSVLRMVQAPQDIFQQPERFLSYFISPAPPVGNIVRSSERISYVLPISSSQYPLTCEYLRAALEAIPTYAGKPMAVVRWDDTRVSVNWSERQTSLFGEETPAPNLNPELLQTIVHNLENSQRQLEETNRQLMLKTEQLEEAQRRLAAQADSALGSASPEIARLAGGLGREIGQPISSAVNNLYRLNDYMARAQQLVTILVGQGRATPQVQEAMRRVDWSFVQKEFPNVVKDAAAELRAIQEAAKDLSLLADADQSAQEPKVAVDLNKLVETAIESVHETSPRKTMIEKQLQMERSVSVYPERLMRALVTLIYAAVRSASGNGSVRVAARSKGPRAEIEISSGGMDSERIAGLFAAPVKGQSRDGGVLGLSLVQSIVKMHQGTLTVADEPGQGSAFVVELPLTN